MRPILFKIGPVPLYAYGFMVALGVALGLWLLGRQARRDGLEAQQWMDVGVWVALAGFLGARAFYVIQFWEDYQGGLLGILRIWEGGFVFYGGVISSLLFLAAYCRKIKVPFLRVTDLLVPFVFLAHGFGRIGCFLNGCCYGIPSKLPWAVKYPFFEHPVHPTQIYSALFNFAGFFLLTWIYRRRSYTGETTLAYFLIYALGRFLIEFLRGDHRDYYAGFTISQWIGIVTVAIVLAVYLFHFRKRTQSTS